jgi:hypothetical protein
MLAHQTTYNKSVSFRKLYFDDVILEVNWNGTLTDFRWLASDHIDEMGFDTISRIGMWINPGGPGGRVLCPQGDLLHMNSISYLGENKWHELGFEEFNPNNILFSSRHTNILAIIDKETGKVVWRVDPIIQKNRENEKLNQLIGPHNAHMIPKGLPGEGNILVFDNGGAAGYRIFGNPRFYRSYSRVIEFNPITLDIVWEYKSNRGLIYLDVNFHKFFTPVMGSAQRLPNGNTLISEGLSRRIFELNADEEIVWECVLQPGYKINRAYRVPPEWVPDNAANYNFWEEN